MFSLILPALGPQEELVTRFASEVPPHSPVSQQPPKLGMEQIF